MKAANYRNHGGAKTCTMLEVAGYMSRVRATAHPEMIDLIESGMISGTLKQRAMI